MASTSIRGRPRWLGRWAGALLGLWAVLWAVSAAAAPVETVQQLPSAHDTVLPYLLSVDGEHPPVAAAVLFNGGAGAVGLMTRGIPHPGANFLVRSRALFVERGIATAVIDVPIDESGMSDSFRSSARHATDVAAVVADLKARLPGLPVFLVGTSRGTVSAAYSGAALGDAVAGVVLTSTVFNSSKGGVGVAGFDFASIHAPLLFVHHVDDRCAVTPYRGAQRLASRYPLISVSGGDPPRSDACEAFSAHGYLGREALTVDAIVRWMRGQDYPKQVP